MMIYQAQRKGCGFASVKMALCHASRRRDFAYAPERMIDGVAPSFAELISYAKQYGLQLAAFRCDKKELLKNEDYPLLLSIEEDGLNHMVFLKKEDSLGRFVVYDPARGKRVFKKEDLAELFDGRYLTLGEYENIAPRFSRPKTIPPIISIASVLLSLAPIAFLSLGILLLGWSGENTPISFPCFALALVSLGGSRLLSAKQLERFDGRFLERVDDDNLRLREERFVRYHRYKAAALSSLSRLLASFLEVAAALSFFAFYDPLLSLCMGCGLLFVTLEHLLDYEKDKKRKEMVEQLEHRYVHSSLEREERMEILSTLSKESARYGRGLFFKETLVISVSIALSAIALTLSNGEFALEQFLFYGLSISALMSQGSSSLSNVEGLAIKKREEPFFFLHFCQEAADSPK